MGAGTSQTNIFAVGTLVSTTPDDVENILRLFERRRAKWSQIEVNGKMVEWIPHTANPPDPAFLLLEEEGEEGEDEGEEEGGLPEGGFGLDTRSKLSLPNSAAGGSVVGGPLFDASIAGQTVSPLPSVFEGGELDDDDGAAPAATTTAPPTANASWHSTRTRLPTSYQISRSDLQDLLQRFGVNSSDCELIDKMFSLVDTRGFGSTDVRDIMLAYGLVVAKDSIGGFLRLMFRTFDRSESLAIERREMLRIFTLVNECIFYFGDRALEPRHIRDLVDSVFTTAGKIDGHVNWTDYIELIEQHPIMEMLFSVQYQGLAREKVFDEHTLRELAVSATFDYSRESKPV